jgi:hypothetical protein
VPAAQFRQVAIAIAPVAVLYVPVPQSVQAVAPTAENEPGAHRVHGTPLGAGLAKAPATHVQSRMDMALLVRVALLAGHEVAFVSDAPLREPHCCGVHVCELLDDTNTDKSKNTVLLAPNEPFGAPFDGIIWFLCKSWCLYIRSLLPKLYVLRTVFVCTHPTLNNYRIRQRRICLKDRECTKQKWEK